jgi:plastocyanin
MRRRRYLAALSGALATAAAGCTGGATDTTDAEFDVGMSINAFKPQTVETTVGETVVWRNTSGRRHTVTAYGDSLPEGATYFASGEFDSEAAAVDGWDARFGGGIDANGTYEHTFEVAGTYPYYCIPHESGGMVGTVEVREE